MSTSLRDDILNAVRESNYTHTQFIKDVSKILDFGIIVVGNKEYVLEPEEIAKKLSKMGYHKNI